MAISSNTKKLLLRIVLFLVYLLVGAAIFYFIEHSNEDERRRNNRFHEKYKNFTDRYKISEKDMIAFIRGLEEAMKLGYNATTGFNGSVSGGWPKHPRWQFMNAFHFAGNVVTTIGYGHIAPETLWGRLICIFYALFGIPLTGLTLRSIGNRISEFIAASIKTLDRRLYNRETEKLEIKTAFLAFAALWFIILIPAIGFSLIEKWAYQDAVYFCFVTLTTIGFGDFVPGQDRKLHEEGIEAMLEFLNLIYMVLGLAVMSGVIVSISGVIEEKTKNFGVDPLEALRNIRVENLNSRALKKLGYKMGPGMGPPGAPGPPNHDLDSSINSRLPPKLAPKAIAVVATSGNDRTMERSRSAEAMDFQGPTPVMYLNKTNGSVPSCRKDEDKTGNPNGSKMFNNKIAPVTLPENEAVTNSPSRKLELRKHSEHNSTSTESAEEARVDDEDSEVKTINELNELREEAELDACEPVNHEPKNNLVIQVQVTPMPSPRESPVHTRPSIDSITTNPKNEDPDTEPIETYEGSIKGSIDSSHAFQSDGTTVLDYHLRKNESKDNESPITNPFLQDAKEKQNPPHKAKTNDVKNNPRTKNGIIPRNSNSKPNVRKQGRTVKTVEHIDLGDQTISKVSR